MVGLFANSKEVRHQTNTEQQRDELQGTSYHDSPNKIMDKDDILVGE
jgi:hypothetical protein